MAENKPVRVKIDQRLTGEAVLHHGRTIQPVAQASGWRWAGGDQQATYGGALVRVQPLEIHVREGEALRIIPMDDPGGNALRAMALRALAVALVCLLVMFVARRFAAPKGSHSRRQPDGEPERGAHRAH
jgi:hypothetical protein